MIRFLRLLIAIVALVLVIGFAVANREVVEVGLAPWPSTIELPVYGVFLLGLVVGALVGGISVWFAGHARRREARKARRRAWALENQLNVVKREADREQAKRYTAVAGAGTRRRRLAFRRSPATDESPCPAHDHRRRRHHGPVQRLGAAPRRP